MAFDGERGRRLNLGGFRTLALPLLLCAALNIHARDSGIGDGTDVDAQRAAFERGTQAYKAGDYTTALDYFDKARIAGSQDATLIYNRAVTLYKLGRLDDAKEAFTGLLSNRAWADLARYNLGRIAEDQRDRTAAYEWYREVSRHADNEKLRGLAARKLAALDKGDAAKPQPAADTAKKGAVLLSLGMVADDNAMSLADELSQSASDASDTYLNALAYGHYYVQGRKDAGTRMYGLAYARRFRTYETFNATVAGFGAAREMSFEDVAAELGARFIRADVDAGRLADQYTLSAKLRKPLSVGRARLDYHSTWYEADKDFAHIEGWQHQLRLTWGHNYGKVGFEPALRWQTNQRDDKETATRFYSYSPTGLGALLDVKWQLSAGWLLHAGIERAWVSYSDANRLTDIGGVFREEKRENTQTRVEFGARYRFSPHWRVKGEYAYTHVDDKFDIYSYAKQVWGVKLEYFN